MASTPRMYTSKDAGAPNAMSGYASGLFAVLDAVLCDGYGTTPSAGWTRVHAESNSRIYKPAGDRAIYYIFRTASAPYTIGAAVAEWLDETKPTLNGKLETAINLVSSSVRPVPTTTTPFIFYQRFSFIQNASDPSVCGWAVVATDETMVFASTCSSAAYTVTVTGSQVGNGNHSHQPLVLYMGRFYSTRGYTTTPAMGIIGGRQAASTQTGTSYEENSLGVVSSVHSIYTGTDTLEPSILPMPDIITGQSSTSSTDLTSFLNYGSSYYGNQYLYSPRTEVAQPMPLDITPVHFSTSMSWSYINSAYYPFGGEYAGTLYGLASVPAAQGYPGISLGWKFGLTNSRTSRECFHLLDRGDGHKYSALIFNRSIVVLTNNPAYWGP